jgi:hypothetical protein
LKLDTFEVGKDKLRIDSQMMDVSDKKSRNEIGCLIGRSHPRRESAWKGA